MWWSIDVIWGEQEQGRGDSRGAESQAHQPGIGARETTGVEIERTEVRLEIDVDPLTSCCASFLDGRPDQPATDPHSLVLRTDDRIDDERMGAAVPSDVHESDQTVSRRRRCPSETVAQLLSPSMFTGLTVERDGMKRLQFVLIDRLAPLKVNVHGFDHATATTRCHSELTCSWNAAAAPPRSTRPWPNTATSKGS